jgi:serine phosphatase RsbU (regulator of sigma subunit)
MSDVRYQALYHDDVALTLRSVNAIVASRVMRGMFVTFIYAVIDPDSGEVTYGNAGHLSPIVRHADGRLSQWDEPRSVPLGIVPEVPYEAAKKKLEKGEVLLLLSDGIGDAVGEGGQRFGDARVAATIAQGPGDPAVLVKGLCDATATFTGNRPQADDQTLLAVALA